MVAVSETSAPHNNQDVTNSGYPGEQPDAESQHQVGHEILTRAELVRRREAESDVTGQTTEPKLICYSVSDNVFKLTN